MARICSFTLSSISVHHLTYTVYAVDDIQAGTIVPVHHEAPGIIDSRNGSLGADGRSLYIVHLEKLHAGACRIAGVERLKLLFCDHSHAGEVLKENLALCLVLVSDEAQPQEEAAVVLEYK